MDDILAKAEKLLEEAKNLQPSYLDVKDLSELADKYLTPSAKLDMLNKALNQVVRMDDGKVYISLYLAVTVIEGLEEDGVKTLAKILNDLSQKGEIHSALSPISSIKLARMSSVPQAAVFAFPLVPADRLKEISERYAPYVSKEGEAGTAIHDTRVPLTQGEFIATIRVSQYAMIHSKRPVSLQEMFQDMLNQYLSVLPKGTTVRKITNLAITSMSNDFEVKFYNPLLQRVRRVELEHVREFAVHPNTVEQLTVLTGIRYFTDDNQELYR